RMRPTATWPARRTSCRRGNRSIQTRRSEEHTSELQSRAQISYAVFCLKQKNTDFLRELRARVLAQQDFLEASRPTRIAHVGVRPELHCFFKRTAFTEIYT